MASVSRGQSMGKGVAPVARGAGGDGRKTTATAAAGGGGSANGGARTGAHIGSKAAAAVTRHISDSEDGDEEDDDDDDEDEDEDDEDDEEEEDESIGGYVSVKGVRGGSSASSNVTSTTSTTRRTTTTTTTTTVTGDSNRIRIAADSPSNDELTQTEAEDDQEGLGDGGDGGDSTEDDSDAWATESFYEDALGNLSEETRFGAHENACTTEQTEYYRRRLREVGAVTFLQETVHARTISARKLITAFGIRPPAFLDGAPDAAFVPLLQAAIGREMSRRRKLKHINTLEDVSRLLKKSKNIIVLTGAGISTSLGIPDFRSKDNGLYSRLAGLGLSDPQEVFDIDVFQDDPTIFYSIAKDILPTTDTFSPTHAFIELLQRKNKLLTQYTQNIDNLETRAGIRPDKLIQCHGSFATASCVKCKYKVEGEKIFPDLRAGKVARCERCLGMVGNNGNGSAAGKKRKRGGKGRGRGREATAGSNGLVGRKQKYSEDSSADEEECAFQEAGVMKPDITFFGEQLPDAFHDRLVGHDHEKCDLLICIGTSLKVAPVSEIIGFLPPDVPQIYISKTPVTHVEFDVELLGSCDDVVVELCRRVGWELKHDMIPEGLVVRIEEGDGRGASEDGGGGGGGGDGQQHKPVLKGRYVFTRG
ncbi:DHS-like NAD/FAD-binding domain-containing protein [Peziza echinospora]|nr:DHS-like NAD/FAD-binding domain-containing protein [Peziza echinospora]